MDFEKLSKQEKAIAVAKDVLLQMSKNVYIPNTGSYINGLEHTAETHSSIKDNFDKIKSCSVCAIGSMLLSATHLGNKLSFEELFVGSHVTTVEQLASPKVGELLSSMFDDRTLFLIEECFEGGYDFRTDEFENPTRYSVNVRGLDTSMITSDEIEKCNSFNMMYGNNSPIALKEICENIIRNNGLFIL